MRSAGGCEIRLNGTDYRAVRPELADGDKAGDVIRAAFGPVERIMFRMLGIRRFLLLHCVLVPEPPGGEDGGV